MDTKEAMRLRFAVEDLVLKCGIHADHKGYDCLVDAVVLFVNGGHNFSEIYKKIGEERGIESRSVMRNITYAVQHSYDIHKYLAELTGAPIAAKDVRCAFVIAHLGRIILRNNDGNADGGRPEE